MLNHGTDEHGWASRTLPWLVNERLTADETRRLQAHLQTCPDCALELQWERALASHIATTPVIAYAPQASLAKLMQRLDAAETRGKPRWWQVMRRPRSGAERRVAFSVALAAQALAIAVLALALSWVATRPGLAPEYRTLTRGVAESPGMAQLQVVFDESVTAAEMRVVLAKINGRIVSGPSPAGVFLVAVDTPAGREAGLDAAARTLAAQPGVSFVAVMRQE